MNFSASKHKGLFITIAVSLLFCSNIFGSDLLDSIKNKTKLVNDLKDVYRAFNINHIISNQNELLNLDLDSGDDNPKNALRQCIKICESLKQTHFSNPTLDAYVHKYLTLTIQSYTIAQTKGFHSAAFKADNKKYGTEYGKYMDYLIKTYPTSYFVNLTEKKYWSTLDKKNYIKSADYPEYEKLKKSDTKAGQALLEKMSNQAINFQEYTVYQIESADLYVKHPAASDNDPRILAIDKYKAIIDQNKYSIYLFEAWVKWRALVQYDTGLSKSSDIPNYVYNKKREQVALTILNHVITHPKDEMAINEFLLMATHDNVKRFGDYSFGNQSTIEYHDLFDDK